MANEIKCGETLRAARDAAEMTQAEAARAVGWTTVYYVSQLELDRRPLSVVNAVNLARAYGCTFVIDADGFWLGES